MTSSLASVRQTDGRLTDTLPIETRWKDRITQAREYRKYFEKIWLSNGAFAAGQHWLQWDEQAKQLVDIRKTSGYWAKRELYTADRINEQMQAQLGELTQEDERPQLLTAQKGDQAQEVQEQLNQAVQFGWDHEWKADSALEQVRSLALTYGTAAIQCVYDPSLGKVVAKDVPHHQGKPVLDESQAFGLIDQGHTLSFKDVREGRTCWRPLSAFHILAPPGVNHEDAFPWEVIMRPVLLDTVKERYGAAADKLTEDGDIASIVGMTTAQAQRQPGDPGAAKGRLRNHVWLFEAYQRPTPGTPDGQVVTLASNQVVLLDVQDRFPYQGPDGTPRTGISYFHWWRLNDRFYSRAFIEPLKDPQRLINRRKVQMAEIIDRGMPKVFLEEGSLPETPAGAPLEQIEIKTGKQAPQYHPGIGPGPWMNADVESLDNDLQHASTLSLLRLGENPPGVSTYSQLATLNESEAGKRSRILIQHERAKAQLVEDSIWDIRQYWPDEKQILVSGDDGALDQQVFKKSSIPDLWMVKVPRGAPKPSTQGAELTKIDAVWAAIQATGIQAHNEKYARWYADSIDAGKMLDLPEPDPDRQSEMAQFENWLMLDQQETPAPAEYDIAAIHVPIHREAQDQARANGDMDAFERIQQHVEAQIQAASFTRKQLRVADPADPTDQDSDTALDEDQALKENQMLIAGQPLNPEAYQAALASLNQGINPETQQPVKVVDGKPADDIRGILSRAADKPSYVENLLVHMDRHGKVIKSEAFKRFPPDVRQRFIDHFDQTRQLYIDLPITPDKVTAPKVSYAVRADVGPTTAQEILKRGGVPEADAATLATEPPMENMVQRTDAAGTGPGGQGAPAKTPAKPTPGK